ncbi:hypothetical protein NTD84_19130 [Pseudomonas sp. 14P_8.1_Bac3]|uniref:hypothetical protein n=1 Tax=Pseudomonas sp. 14P_8.1_Bac3 TaxID=2971621 RepID=UPI0021C9B43F|nr:hypothetical protein [Pseudomonas sp. 14P_8.1_Bac3]MCU1761820.1 hypothetical protein [Pseudomonas sp. 14P_8.1_Bac3]
MQLIHRYDRERLGIGFRNIESPFFAKSEVEAAFNGHSFHWITGLEVRTHGRLWSKQEVIDAVEKGDLLLVSDNPFDPLSNDLSGTYSSITHRGWSSNNFRRPTVQDRPVLPDADPLVRHPPQEPGFYVVPKSMTAEKLIATLFPVQNQRVMSKFHSLNPELDDVKAGTMIVLGDPNNLQCTQEEALLMEAAARTREALDALSPEEADFMVRHREEIETFLSHGSTGIGIGEAIFASHLKNMENVLRDIEALHIRTFNAEGHLRSPDFFAERKRLLARLNDNLTALTRKSIGLPDHPNLKNALGISSRSLVHRWTKAGAAGQIPGYATHIEGVAKAASVVKYGGWIGTAIGGGASSLKVQDVCVAGSVEACRKIKFTETGSFVGGVLGGAATSGALSGANVLTLCVGLGVPTGGIASLICGVMVVGVTAFAGSTILGTGGEMLGEMIYESHQ